MTHNEDYYLQLTNLIDALLGDGGRLRISSDLDAAMAEVKRRASAGVKHGADLAEARNQLHAAAARCEALDKELEDAERTVARQQELIAKWKAFSELCGIAMP